MFTLPANLRPTYSVSPNVVKRCRRPSAETAQPTQPRRMSHLKRYADCDRFVKVITVIISAIRNRTMACDREAAMNTPKADASNAPAINSPLVEITRLKSCAEQQEGQKENTSSKSDEPNQRVLKRK